MVSEARETFRYWVNFFVKNWLSIAAILPLLGISVYSTNESMSKDSDIVQYQNQITEMAPMIQTPKTASVSRETIIEKHYIEKCTKCSELIHLNNVKYHGVKP